MAKQPSNEIERRSSSHEGSSSNMIRRADRRPKVPAATVSRRHVLGMGAVGLGALAGATTGISGCKTDTNASAATSSPAVPGSATKPEMTDLRFGMIALTDCSPIVVAHEKGLFKKYGINSTVVKGASWAAIRDSLSNGDIHATHMLIGMPIASTIGLMGAPKKPMVIPWLLNRNGQAISLKAEWKGKVAG